MTVWISRRSDADVNAEVARSRSADGVLAGISLAVKDNVDVAGSADHRGVPRVRVSPPTRRRVGRGTARGRRRRGRQDQSRPVRHRASSAPGRPTAPCPTVAAPSSSAAVPVRGPRSRWRPGRPTSPSAPTPPDRDGSPRDCRASSASNRPLGVVSTDGVVPACESYDCVTIFARDLELANRAMGVMAAGAPDRAVACRHPARGAAGAGRGGARRAARLDASGRRRSPPR